MTHGGEGPLQLHFPVAARLVAKSGFACRPISTALMLSIIAYWALLLPADFC